MWKLIEILFLKNNIGNLFPNLCFIYNVYLNLKFDCEREPVYSPSWPVFNALYLNCYNCWTIHLTGPKFLWGILHMYPFYKIAWLMTNGLVQLYRVSQIIATFHFTPVLQQSTICFFSNLVRIPIPTVDYHLVQYFWGATFEFWGFRPILSK